MRLPAVVIVFLLAALIAPPAVFAIEDIQHRKVVLDRVTCHIGILYKDVPGGIEVGVSAIATGKGAEFRKWEVTYLKISALGEKIRPDEQKKFFVKEESLWRVPSAVVFAAIGTQIDVSGSQLQKGIAKAGTAIGLGLLVLQAEGDIAGETCVFRFTAEQAKTIDPKTDYIEVRVEDKDQHWTESIKIPMQNGPKNDVAKRSEEQRAGMQDELDRLHDESWGVHEGQ